jgi:chaperone required for assembly of F1-ATPase
MTDETSDDRMKRLVTAQFKKQLPRKFYNSVEVSDTFAVFLDGKQVKTPLKNTLILPNRAMAEAVAAEWLVQDKVIDPETMPLTKLANTALDRATQERAHVLDEIAQYAGSDLVCYWADRPPELVALQRKHWQPVLDWAEKSLEARFVTAIGINHVRQDAAVISAIGKIAQELDAWQLTGTYLTMTMTGSALLALMLQSGATTAEVIWAAAHVDDDYQISQWGEDWEAAERRAARKREFDGLVRFFQMLRTRV